MGSKIAVYVIAIVGLAVHTFGAHPIPHSCMATNCINRNVYAVDFRECWRIFPHDFPFYAALALCNDGVSINILCCKNDVPLQNLISMTEIRQRNFIDFQ